MDRSTSSSPMNIAIISVAGRFPRAASCDELWQAIVEGRELVSSYDDVPPNRMQGAVYVPRGAFLELPETFDYGYFRYTPREASRMDPQQRQCLEICHHALQQAGYGRGSDAGRCGVFVGTRPDTWHQQHVRRPDESSADALLTLAGGSSDALATRVAYKLDCTGPALNVANFCSGSLVAVHLACRSLMADECDMALAGGVCVRYPAHCGYWHYEGGIMSRQGQVRAFDAAADGTLFADAVGFVALRRLRDAERDGNTILAVIRGSAINNDGVDKAGYSAPGVSGQEAAIRSALSSAGMQAQQIGMIEAHGTGTPVGDAVELRALSRVFDNVAARTCGIGSVKSTLGHADCASGISGLIKTIYAVRLGIIPPATHCDQPCQALSDVRSPFMVASQARRWCESHEIRAAGVSSFGIGGTNVHMIVVQPPPISHIPTREPLHLIPLSATNAITLQRVVTDLLNHLHQHPDIELADVAYTLQRGRQHWPVRKAIVAGSLADLISGLRQPQGVVPGSSSAAVVTALATSWQQGETLDWTRFYPQEQRRRLALPSYPLAATLI
ncbi:beta-ketoacyl synthase N-terminal-like domain-containing protein [Erwinia amylovora]|uniref:beta-ketoacyl synthase N-terminal-like domain-containing protein n=1 Tax=Erwinia amylovora TaxID=552 RepID=UPI000C0879F4|nr:polyketide synthase [Erwinia amylovora]